MKKLYTLSLMAIMLLAFQVTFSQVDDQTVELDEVVLSLPFSQTLGKSVIKVDKIKIGNGKPGKFASKFRDVYMEALQLK